MIRLSIDIPNELHHFLKVYTAHKNDTIMNFVREAIYHKIEQEKELNAESIKILEESAKGLNINKYSSYKEMYKKLNLI
ncbi:hypothetical protein MCC_05190 [Rickettsia rhipicephali str. 3-7-female6-CWPP]|uniref:Antitoxin n=2 Tax=Rickettsia rhipicephali TaxID=33992 RepID=A0AAI8AA49_RICR3|nr:hypothetical protein [Rickettsia rhipicephali]AFC72565.1 hypothetical protein MCC_05190 [Rickettsia rhipicephali str. 3-7-female6-CWPP]